MKDSSSGWLWFFIFAAGFNFCTGGAIFFDPKWSYSIAYLGTPDASTLRFWADFGFAVLLIGVGYVLVAFDLKRGRGIVLLGVLAKAFDVIVLPSRLLEGLAHEIVLLPAAVDGLFCVGFVVFLIGTRSEAFTRSP